MDTGFTPGWPIEERKYLSLLRKIATANDYTLRFRVAAGGLWIYADILKLNPEVFNMTRYGNRAAQLEGLAVLLDTQPEEVAVMCVYLGYADYCNIHGHKAHPVPKILHAAHVIAALVLDIRRKLITEADIEPVVVMTGEFEFSL